MVDSGDHLLALLSPYKTIITDRLHVATGAMLLRKTTVLMPNFYHKNKSMYETWLKDLGCLWLETFREGTLTISDDNSYCNLQTLC